MNLFQEKYIVSMKPNKTLTMRGFKENGHNYDSLNKSQIRLFNNYAEAKDYIELTYDRFDEKVLEIKKVNVSISSIN